MPYIQAELIRMENGIFYVVSDTLKNNWILTELTHFYTTSSATVVSKI